MTSVAGVRGTVYRMNVHQDNSAVVKVYWGEVVVSSLSEKGAAAPAPPKMVSAPKKVSGPHPVSMAEWTYIVRSMQQIVINPDGSATKPFMFTIDADMNDWVRWNQSRDKGIEDQTR